VREPIWAGRLSVRAKARTGWLPGAASHGSWKGCVSQFSPASSSLARKVLGWPKRCKLAYALPWKNSGKRRKLAQATSGLTLARSSIAPAAPSGWPAGPPARMVEARSADCIMLILVATITSLTVFRAARSSSQPAFSPGHGP
jgi:hypothetical protein